MMGTRGIAAVIAAAAVLGVLGLSLAIAGSSGPEKPQGFTFSMTMESPGRDAVTLAGAALGPDMRLEGKVGGIQSVTLLTGGDLYVLTPAIRTARAVENPDPPAKDSADWPEWLLEPGRVNPLVFFEVLQQDEEVDGRMRFAAGSRVEAVFEEGRLLELRFPSPSGEGSVVYQYSDFEEDGELGPEDFEVPSGYKVTE